MSWQYGMMTSSYFLPASHHVPVAQMLSAIAMGKGAWAGAIACLCEMFVLALQHR